MFQCSVVFTSGTERLYGPSSCVIDVSYTKEGAMWNLTVSPCVAHTYIWKNILYLSKSIYNTEAKACNNSVPPYLPTLDFYHITAACSILQMESASTCNLCVNGWKGAWQEHMSPANPQLADSPLRIIDSWALSNAKAWVNSEIARHSISHK